MNPFPAGPVWIAAWAEHDGVMPVSVVLGGPEEGPDVIPCPVLVRRSGGARVMSVAYQLEDIEIERLINGGVLWMHTWGGLPIHALEVHGGE